MTQLQLNRKPGPSITTEEPQSQEDFSCCWSPTRSRVGKSISLLPTPSSFPLMPHFTGLNEKLACKVILEIARRSLLCPQQDSWKWSTREIITPRKRVLLTRLSSFPHLSSFPSSNHIHDGLLARLIFTFVTVRLEQGWIELEKSRGEQVI